MIELFDKIKKYSTRNAFIYKDRKIKFSQVFHDIKLIKKKIRNHSIIFVFAENTYSSIISYLSSINGNNITLVMDPKFEKKYIEKMIKIYNPNYIFKNSKSNFKVYGKLVFKFEDINLIKTSNNFNKKINFQNFLLLTTSGTTKNPKVVRLGKNNLLDNTKKIVKSLNIRSSHNTITTLPFSYSYGLSILNSHFFSGATVVINNYTIFDKNFWTSLEKYKVTSFGGVPQLYKQLKLLKFPKTKYPYLKYLTQAGGKLDKELIEYFYLSCKKNNIKFIIMYGQTEASPRISYLPWKFLPKKIGSIGKGLSGYKIFLVDKNKKIIKKNYKEGELAIKGKNVFLGYAESLKDLYTGDINKELLYTGDLAIKDKDGFYYINGRKNIDLILMILKNFYTLKI